MNTEKRALPVTAGEIAKRRLDDYLAAKLNGAEDDAVWKFYMYLLDRAKKEAVDNSGYRCFEYQDDYDTALKNIKEAKSE